VTERIIREAQEAGDFDDLPGRGRRLDLDDDPREGELGLAFHILRTNDAVPPWIAADREARRTSDEVERLIRDTADAAAARRITPRTRARIRARLEQAMRAHAHAVEALNVTAPSTSLHRRPYDRLATEARLERALAGRADSDDPR
jgi:DnaJ family protein C protein 28